MSHQREIIRNNLVARLRTKKEGKHLTDAEDRVYANRTKALFDQFLPAILVYCNSENILEEKLSNDGYGALKRELDIAIEAVILGDDDSLDKRLDNLATQIENSLESFELLPQAHSLKLRSTEIDSSIEGSKIYGAVRLNYLVTYYTATNAL